MKKMSRVAFLSRHPLMTGFYLTFIGACLYGPITLGKALFLTYFSIAIRLGIYFEERQLKREVGPLFEDFCRIIPNLVIPDVKALFYSSSELGELRKRLTQTKEKKK